MHLYPSTISSMTHQMRSSSLRASRLACEIEANREKVVMERGFPVIATSACRHATVVTKTHCQKESSDQHLEPPPVSLLPQHTGLLTGALNEVSSIPTTVSSALDVPTIASDIEHLENGRPSPMPDLSLSPLTASSFHVMEQEYDRDTWRMYRRITTARDNYQNVESVTQSMPVIRKAGILSCHTSLKQNVSNWRNCSEVDEGDYQEQNQRRATDPEEYDDDDDIEPEQELFDLDL